MDTDELFWDIQENISGDLTNIGTCSSKDQTHKAILNKVFHRYLNKVQKINSAGKISLHQWLQGIFFVLYGWIAGQVEGTDIYQSVLAIGRELPFTIDLSPAMVREGNSGLQKSLDHNGGASPLFLDKESCLKSWYRRGG